MKSRLSLVWRSRDRPTRRLFSRAVLLAAVAIAVQAVLAVGPSAAAARGRGSGLVLHVSAARNAYAVGDQVRLNISLINRTGARIWVDHLADGTVQIERLTRTAPGRHARAVAVQPRTSTVDFDEGLGSLLEQALRPVAPGSTVHESELSGPFPGGQALYGVDGAGSLPRLALYPLTAAGRYRLTLRYRFPTGPGAPAAAFKGASSTASVTFRLTQARAAGSDARSLATVLVTARHGRRLHTILVPDSVRDTAIGRTFASDLTDCLKRFQAPGGDPDHILPTLQNPRFPILIEPTLSPASSTSAYPQGSRSAPNGVPRIYGGSGVPVGSLIRWNPFDVSPYVGSTVPREPCASLYHELYHAYQNATASTDNRPYRGTRLPTREVLAVRAENDWRSRHGLPLRTSYATGWPYGIQLIPLPLTTPRSPSENPCDGSTNGNGQPCFLRIEVNGDEGTEPADTWGIGIVTIAPGTGQPTFAQSTTSGGFPSGSWASQFNDVPGCLNGDLAVDVCYQFAWTAPKTITLTAIPVPHGGYGESSPTWDSEFTHWGGDCSGSSKTCTLRIGSQKSTTGGYSLAVTAYFDATGTAVG
jgi:hypothetical protein